MNKIFKLMGLALLAGALTLTSCDKDPNNGNNNSNNEESTIVAAKIQNGTYGNWGTCYGIDADGDGTLEYRIKDGMAEVEPYARVKDGGLDLSATWTTGGTNVWTLSAGYPASGWDVIKPLASGTTVDASGCFGSEGDANLAPTGNGDIYVGLRIKLSDGVHYGWALVSVSTGSGEYDYTATWKECYYETTPNTAIKVGEK